MRGRLGGKDRFKEVNLKRMESCNRKGLDTLVAFESLALGV